MSWDGWYLRLTSHLPVPPARPRALTVLRREAESASILQVTGSQPFVGGAAESGTGILIQGPQRGDGTQLSSPDRPQWWRLADAIPDVYETCREKTVSCRDCLRGGKSCVQKAQTTSPALLWSTRVIGDHFLSQSRNVQGKKIPNLETDKRKNAVFSVFHCSIVSGSSEGLLTTQDAVGWSDPLLPVDKGVSHLWEVSC